MTTQQEDTFDWLKSLQKSPIDKFVDNLGGKVVVSNDNEIIILAPVLNLLRLITPIQNFYLPQQRSVDEDRVESMYLSQLKEYHIKGYYSITTTIISFGYCVGHETPKLLDGQHRTALLRRVNQFFPKTLANEMTLVKIFKVEQESELVELFQTINKNYVPVPMYNTDDTIREVIDGVLNWFRMSFDGVFFKTPPTGKVQRPFINLDGSGNNLRDWLSNNQKIQDIITGQSGDVSKSVQMICEKLGLRNDFLKNQNAEEFMVDATDRACLHAHAKCLIAKKQCFLGMKKNYELIEEALIIKKVIHIKQRSILD